MFMSVLRGCFRELGLEPGKVVGDPILSTLVDVVVGSCVAGLIHSKYQVYYNYRTKELKITPAYMVCEAQNKQIEDNTRSTQ